MNLQGQNILIAAQFAPPFGGNFIPSVKALADKLEGQVGAKVFFAFPSAARDLEWARTLNEEYTVFFTGDTSRLIYREEAHRIVKECKPALIYTHFEGYDTVFLPFINKSVPVAHHMHDALYYQRHPLKAIFQVYKFWLHYGKPSLCQKTAYIAVCQNEIAFIRPYLLWKNKQQMILPNSVPAQRIKQVTPPFLNPIKFLTIGGRNASKRIDIILKAAIILRKRYTDFVITILKGIDTLEVLNKIFNGTAPEWIEVLDATPDINTAFCQADCYISASEHETFSYAVAEATLAGLPVIQSDIEGTRWNASNPSTFLFKSGSAEDLATAMGRVMESDKNELRHKCIITAAHNREALSLNNWIERIIDFFKTL